MWHGVGLAVMMFVASELSSISLNQYYYLMYRVGTRVQSVLTAAVYRKVSYALKRVGMMATFLDHEAVERGSSAEDSWRNRQPYGNRH